MIFLSVGIRKQLQDIEFVFLISSKKSKLKLSPKKLTKSNLIRHMIFPCPLFFQSRI